MAIHDYICTKCGEKFKLTSGTLNTIAKSCCPKCGAADPEKIEYAEDRKTESCSHRFYG
jgi:putative FmdB family regulatory protein